MQKYLMLTYGFEPPTPEIMNAWKSWFETIQERIVEQGHLPRGVEFSKQGRQELSLGPTSLTGYLIVHAESLEDAEKMASTNPYIASIQVYEIK